MTRSNRGKLRDFQFQVITNPHHMDALDISLGETGRILSSIHPVSSAYSHHQDTQHLVLDVANHPVVPNPLAPQPSKRAAESFAPLARIG